MKKHILEVIAMIFVTVLMIALLASCGNKDNTTGDNEGSYSHIEKQVESIILISTNGMTDSYEIIYTDGTGITVFVYRRENGDLDIQSKSDEYGYTPNIIIQNERWYVDGIDTGIYFEGHKEETLSAFEIYKKYHPEYTGTKEEWFESLKNDVGIQEDQSVNITDTYVDEKQHLWIVFSDGTRINVGYVGATQNPSSEVFTVNFLDYDGSLLKEEKVEKGKNANPPEAPMRVGYSFGGWSCSFDNVSSNLNVMAEYIIEYNQLCFTYDDNGKGTLTVTLMLAGYVHMYGLEFKLLMDTVGLSYKSLETKATGAAANYNTDHIKMSYVSDTGLNEKKEIILLEIEFEITEANYSVEFSLIDVDAFDDVFDDEKYVVAGDIYKK